MLRLVPPPRVTPFLARILDYLPHDGSWQDMQGIRGPIPSILDAGVHALAERHGMIEHRPGRTLKSGARVPECRLTAEGIAFCDAQLARPVLSLGVHAGTVPQRSETVIRNHSANRGAAL